MLLERVGAFAVARRVAILVTAAVLALVAIVVVVHGGRLTTGSVEGLEAVDASHAVAQITGAAEDSTIVAVFSSETMSPLDTSFRKARDLALAKARADEHVLRVTTKDDAPPLLRERMLNAKAKSETVFIVLRGDFKEAAAAYPRVRRDLAQGAGEGEPLSPLSVECTGRIPYMHDLDLVLEHDLLFAEAISLPIALALLLYVFRTWRLALVPVLCGATSVLISIALVTALSFFVEIEAYTINVMSLIGLGVAIDYSLFIVSRYREELGDVANPSAEKMASALVRSVATAGRAVLFSGLAVGVGLVGLVFFRGSVLAAMGAGGAVVVVFAVLVALVFVPAFLAVLGPRAFRGMVRKSTRAKDEARWEAFARGVMRHPWLVLIPTVTVLVLAARPFARIEMSGADVRVLDSRSEARRAYDDLARDFPDQAATRAEVVVQFPRAPALNAERIRALYTFSREVAKLPGVDKVESIVDRASTDPDEDDDAASYEENLLRPSELAAPIIAAAKSLTVGERDTVLYVRIHGASDSREARAVVAALREHRSIADGTLIVGGTTATDVDTTAFMLKRAPRAILFIVLVTLIVLFLQLKSVLLPIKAVLMNALSIGASFGALVWVFQDGRLFVLVGRPLEPTLPVLLFAVIFGLSMDYEVLILARVREEFRRTGDAEEAVAKGLSKTAGLVTSAAAIMVSVFAAFVLARVVLVQATGFGMALAVFVDATLLRVLLVPATMKLLGRWNFWPGERARTTTRENKP